MCTSTPFTRDEYDRPAMPAPALKAEPHWPHFVAADNGHCWPDQKRFHVRLPGSRAGADKWVGVSLRDAESAAEAYDCPVEVGAFVVATERAADPSREMRQFRQLIRLLEMAAEVAMDMLHYHGRLCACPLCVWLAALDDRQPGMKAAVWARVAELPAVVRPAASFLDLWVTPTPVSPARPIRLTTAACEYSTPAVAVAYPERAAATPAQVKAAPRPFLTGAK
ncbi:hypothetical protein [Limnoglobus roseus]|uniref:Uncharacterized protein n=1 Tax=Limnoglobus roseus TaxID=2598579 RepID=A0A5C1AF45_9BACT|nr:hypothetical protein [Limnoglobus roseus]QEL17420.1 hypothetical protein PX52LOC_04409 [Limnoglobus roseus]